jgi:hypothetical protein
VLQAIVDAKEFPQAGDAGTMIEWFESGEFKPT